MNEISTRLLLVEDNPSDIYLVKELLRDSESGARFNVTVADHLDDALALPDLQSFDIILLDLTPPDEYGLNSLKRLQAQTPSTPIIVITSLSNETIAVDAMQVGAQDYLVKNSLHVEVLVRSIHYAIERANISNELRKREAQYRLLAAIVESSDDAIIGKSLDGTILSWNQSAERMYGFTADEMLGRSVGMLMTPEEPDDVPELLKHLSQGERIVQYETVRQTKSGKRIDVSLTISPVCGADGAVTMYATIARDITQHKQAEVNQLELQIERERARLFKEFTTDISHDLRTPLTIIKTSLFLLRTTITASEQQLRYLENVERQTVRIQNIIEDYFTLSKLELGSARFSFEPTDLNTLLEMVCDQQQTHTIMKKHTLSLSLDANLLSVNADPCQLMVALKQILVNALNYTPDGGEILLRTYRQDQQAIVAIMDNGIGICSEDLPHIYERLYRVDQARSMETGGTGLGLTIAKKVVEMHTGRMWVESSLGQGSTFYISIPLMAKAS